MRILLATNSLMHLAGTETWTHTMYTALSKAHEVWVYANDGNRLFPDLPKHVPNDRYDVALINHTSCMEALLAGGPIAPRIIQTCHGVLSELEQPMRGAHRYVAVSEEIAAHMKIVGYNATIIRNPVNTQKFMPVRRPNRKLENILFISNRQSPALTIVEEAARGFNYRQIGGLARIHETVDAINWADLVISLGRGCLEAMSCRRNVIVYDRFGADGFVTPESMLEFRKCNCSGRRYRLQLTAAQLRDMFGRYDASLGHALRSYVLKNNAVEHIAAKYLSLRP